MKGGDEQFFEFGPFRVDSIKRLLLKDGLTVPLPSKAFDVLLILLENRGRVVDRNVLMKRLWPDTFVEEINLNVHISSLRKTLGENASDHRYIVTVPRRGYSFVAEVSSAGNSTERPPFLPKSSGAAIAVFPFRHLSADSEEYLGLGMTDALITKLSNIKSIAVRPMSAVLRYKNSETDSLTAGRELGVEIALEGKIQQVGERIRVTVQMLRVRDKETLWAESFDESFTNIFALQDSISMRVAQAVSVKLNAAEQRSMAKRHTENMAAYQAYIRGRYFWNKRLGDGLMRAVEHFKQAIEHDPAYAPAYSGMADSYVLLSIYTDADQRDVLPKAKASAMKAIEIDDELAEAHNSLAYIKMRYDWDWAGAEEEFRKALALNPDYATAHQWYGEYFMLRGRMDAAVSEFERALEFDPLSIIINSDLGWVLYYARDYDGAIKQSRKTLELEPDFTVARLALALAYEQKGMYEEALAELKRGNMDVGWARIARIFAVSGKREQSFEMLKKHADEDEANPGMYYPIAGIYAGLEDKDQTMRWLEKAYRVRREMLLYLKVDPRFDIMRTDARFQDLLRRVGL